MAGKSNRIEVDLQVLQAEAIQKLEKFGTDFNNTVDRLAKILDKSQMAGASVPTGTPGTVSPGASTSAQTDQQMLNVQQARNPGSEEAVEEALVRTQRRIMGNEVAIPTSLRQALGYAAEGQLNLNPFQPVETFRADRARIESNPNLSPEQKKREILKARFGAANDIMFNYESTKALGMNYMHKYGNFFGGIQGISSAGYQTAPNTGTGGVLGSSIFSGSFWHGLGESVWQPMVSSTFGLDPGYSLGQAQQARQAINAYGWSGGNMGNWLSGVLKENTKRYMLDPETQMAFLDPMLRWGGWQSFDQLEATLRALPSAAQAAGMNVKQFTQELVQTAQQVAMQNGNTPGVVANVLSNFSATTGLAPQQGAELMSTQNIMMAAAYTGKNPWDIYTGRDQGALMAMSLSRFQNMLGMGVDQFARMAKGSKADREFFKNRMWAMTMLYSKDPSIFGGMSPLQLMNIIHRNGGVGGVERHMQIEGQIANVVGPTRAEERAKIEHLLRRFQPGGVGDSLAQQFAKAAGTNMDSGTMKAYAEQLLRRQMHNQQLKSARNITIELSGDAKKYFALQGDPGHQNSGGIAGFGRKALSITEDVIHLGGGIFNAFP